MRIDPKRIESIMRKAEEEILAVYQRPFAIEEKDDKSPLTEADRRAHHVIEKELLQYLPQIPVLSEESATVPYEQRKLWEYFWLVDPLDGTKEFIRQNGEFTINIALIHHQRPIFGMVWVPVSHSGFFGIQGQNAFEILNDGSYMPLPNHHPSYLEKDHITVVGSRSHASDEVIRFVDQLKASGKEVNFMSKGSSLKFCMVARGDADVYPRFGPTMEWDTAAADIIAECCGRKVKQWPSMLPMIYNKPQLLNPWFIVD